MLQLATAGILDALSIDLWAIEALARLPCKTNLSDFVTSVAKRKRWKQDFSSEREELKMTIAYCPRSLFFQRNEASKLSVPVRGHRPSSYYILGIFCRFEYPWQQRTQRVLFRGNPTRDTGNVSTFALWLRIQYICFLRFYMALLQALPAQY